MKHYTCDKSTRDKAFKYYVTSKISENIHETPEGFLLCLGVPIARTGEMVYGKGETPLEVDEDGQCIIDRDEAEVFRDETIASFEGKAVTITHPTEFVDPENWSELAKGILQNVRRGEGDNKDDLIADLLITDSMAINLVKNGLREVSCGYEAEYIQTGKGRGKQTNIIGNHLALVEQGRAGSAYAINDHKGKGTGKMTLKERIKSIFAKAQDEAMKIADEEQGKKDESKEGDKSKDAGAYDELVKMVKDLGEKVAALGGKKSEEKSEDEEGKEDKKPEEKKSEDESEESKEDKKSEDEEGKEDKKPEEKKSEDEESEGEVSLEDRLKSLEAAVSKLLEKEANESEDEEGEESEGMMTGDAASRAEILAPGIEVTKDVKVKALKAAYQTKEGKKVIDSLTGGKAPAYDSAEKVNTLFIAASELLKAQRSGDLSKTKQVKDHSSGESSGAKSAEEINAINAKFYNKV